MSRVSDAFQRFKGRLEITQTEQEDASRRQKDVRATVQSSFEVEADFLTGSYGRRTKTKPLKDIDIFVVLGRGERWRREKHPREVLDDLEKCLVDAYGRDQVERDRRCITVWFDKRNQTQHEDGKILSLDVVPAFAAGEHYEIPDEALGGWITTDPSIHAEKATAKNQALSGGWVPLVKMLKSWNRFNGKPIQPTFLVEVMALDLVETPFAGFAGEARRFFAAASDTIDHRTPKAARSRDGCRPRFPSRTTGRRRRGPADMEVRVRRLLPCRLMRPQASDRSDAAAPTEQVGNSIPRAQRADSALLLLRARQATYASSTRLHIVQLLATVAAPVAAATTGLLFEAARPYVVIASVVASVADIVVFDRLQRKLLERAAKIAEQFDVEVLQMPWNTFVVGKRVDPEVVHEAAGRWTGRNKMAALEDWYPVAVECAPLSLARIICQRTNLWYDSTLRRKYGNMVVWLAVLVVADLVIVAAGFDLKFLDLVTTAMVPALPILLWAARERFRQNDTAEGQERLKAEAEAFWDRAKSGSYDDRDCLERSRELQNSIYTRRASSPMILPFVYWMYRRKMEASMNVGAEQMLKEAGLLTANQIV